ncbi:MAG: adenylate cyclase [Myxococcota bacterium]|jgi:adenylate cyclase
MHPTPRRRQGGIYKVAMSQQSPALHTLINRMDPWLTALALGAVVLSLIDLALGSSIALSVTLRLIDLLLLGDLLLKLFVLGRSYRTSPWFVIDALSSLPVLDLILGVGPAVRTVRALRALRVMRLMRTLQSMQMLTGVEAPLPRSLRLGISGLVAAYAGILIAANLLITQTFDVDTAQIAEGFLVFGSLLGVLVTISAMRLLLPALSDKQLRALFRVTLPSQLAERIITEPDAYHRTEQTHATIIFCDISGFTSSVERLRGDMDAVKHHLEQVMDAVVSVFQRHDLIIDKFIGDAVMAFRGGELVEGSPTEHARRAVSATLEAIAAVEALQDPHFQHIKIGGASTDDALIGAFGTSHRLSYTILGDRVNLAARLEAAVKQTGTTNLFCEVTHALLADDARFRWRRFGRLSLAGKTEPELAYEVFATDETTDWVWLARYDAALVAYEDGRLEEARSGFDEADQLRPGGDKPSQRWRVRCVQLLATPLIGDPPPFSVGK